jgi:SAM-dependent methyltransferase
MTNSLEDRPELPFGLTDRDQIPNYFAWLAGLVRPHIRGRILDHGAGTGALSQALLQTGMAPLVALEPDPMLAGLLGRKFGTRADVEVFHGTIEDYAERAGTESLGAIVSSNVLEHIVDDDGCLRAMWRCIEPGGAVVVYVPARQELFGSLDEAVGHLRRYSRSGLAAKLARAGFDVEHLSYRNLVGVLPWLLAGRVLRKTALTSQNVKFFDRIVFPIGRHLEDLLRRPYGLSVLAVARKRR